MTCQHYDPTGLFNYFQLIRNIKGEFWLCCRNCKQAWDMKPRDSECSGGCGHPEDNCHCVYHSKGETELKKPLEEIRDLNECNCRKKGHADFCPEKNKCSCAGKCAGLMCSCNCHGKNPYYDAGKNREKWDKALSTLRKQQKAWATIPIHGKDECKCAERFSNLKQRNKDLTHELEEMKKTEKEW